MDCEQPFTGLLSSLFRPNVTCILDRILNVSIYLTLVFVLNLSYFLQSLHFNLGAANVDGLLRMKQKQFFKQKGQACACCDSFYHLYLAKGRRWNDRNEGRHPHSGKHQSIVW